MVRALQSGISALTKAPSTMGTQKDSTICEPESGSLSDTNSVILDLWPAELRVKLLLFMRHQPHVICYSNEGRGGEWDGFRKVSTAGSWSLIWGV
jgi:hypothetical protein